MDVPSPGLRNLIPHQGEGDETGTTVGTSRLT